MRPNFVRMAVRIAESQTAIPVKHDMALPLFEDEAYEGELEGLREHAKAISEGVDRYLESLIEKMESDGSVLPGELENLEASRPEHLKSICTTLIEQACGPEEEEEEEMLPAAEAPEEPEESEPIEPEAAE
jgi:hypothetical protein